MAVNSIFDSFGTQKKTTKCTEKNWLDAQIQGIITFRISSLRQFDMQSDWLRVRRTCGKQPSSMTARLILLLLSNRQWIIELHENDNRIQQWQNQWNELPHNRQTRKKWMLFFVRKFWNRLAVGHRHRLSPIWHHRHSVVCVFWIAKLLYVTRETHTWDRPAMSQTINFSRHRSRGVYFGSIFLFSMCCTNWHRVRIGATPTATTTTPHHPFCARSNCLKMWSISVRVSYDSKSMMRTSLLHRRLQCQRENRRRKRPKIYFDPKWNRVSRPFRIGTQVFNESMKQTEVYPDEAQKNNCVVTNRSSSFTFHGDMAHSSHVVRSFFHSLSPQSELCRWFGVVDKEPRARDTNNISNRKENRSHQHRSCDPSKYKTKENSLQFNSNFNFNWK